MKNVTLCLMFLLSAAMDRNFGLRAEPPRQLTTDGLLKRDPRYAENGQAIVYSVRHPSPRMVLMKLDLKTKRLTRLYPQSPYVEIRPTFSKNDRRLAFLRMTGNDEITLIVDDLTGKAASDPPRGVKTSRKVPWNATIFPDGESVVYNLAGQLYRLDLNSNRETQLTKSSGRNDWPAVSPDGRRIAFVSSRDGDYDLYVMDAKGNNLRRLTSTSGMDIRPSWSPDGQRIAFTSNRDRNYEIYVLDTGVRDTNPTAHRLTHHPERDDYPAWRPDGKRLVIVSEREGRFDLSEIDCRPKKIVDQRSY